ncbi:MFS general substrate transporter [Hyaloscypha variabilis F]|uniref:MFS general substrate transporter n=1 Tax=Hyaloscypha variabilis (strain UAMH 11265 / GT02V1 / F) TaxID=1149755 RepID=A0A2J6R8X8_HYAVF|nr:MFS general substrate transporter [Hyaloscypha variabilis F]
MKYAPESRTSVDKPLGHVDLVENLPSQNVPHFYAPRTPQEAALDRSINMKLDLIVLPLLAFNFMEQLCGIDKTNIGNAATTKFARDAHLQINDISNAVSLLSVTFVTLQPLSTIIGRRVGVKYWISFMMIAWGSLCMAHAGIKNRQTLIALRLLLGAAEAGFVPSVFFYLSTWYPKYHLGFRLGLFAGMYSIAGAFSGLIAYGVFQIHSSKYKSWQLLVSLCAEGGITIFAPLIIFLALPLKQNTAWFLTQTEREHSLRRMDIDVMKNFEVDEDGNAIKETRMISMRDIRDALTDWKKLLTVVFNILATLPVSAFGTFLPLIVKGMGYSGVKANLMSVSPFVVGAFGLFVFVYSSDHFHERSLHTVTSMALALIGLIVMYTSSDPHLRYGFTHVCLAGAFSAGPLIVGWLANNTPLLGPRSLIIRINGYSNIAGVIAGQLFKAQYAPSYGYPLKITMILIGVGMLGFVGIRTAYMYENHRRSKQIASWDEEQRRVEDRGENGRRGDQRWTFMFTY